MKLRKGVDYLAAMLDEAGYAVASLRSAPLGHQVSA